MESAMPVFRRKVNYYETDRMEVVHNSNYMRYMEEARMYWMDALGMNCRELEERGIVIPCVSAEQKFRDYLRYDDIFTVKLVLEEFTGVRMKFSYEFYNEASGVNCFSGTSEHYFAKQGDYKPMSLKRKHPKLFKQLADLVKA